MVLKVKGKIAPFVITLLLPESVKYFQVLRESSSHLRRNLHNYAELPDDLNYNLEVMKLA